MMAVKYEARIYSPRHREPAVVYSKDENRVRRIYETYALWPDESASFWRVEGRSAEFLASRTASDVLEQSE